MCGIRQERMGRFVFPEAIGECREIGAVPPIGASFNDPEMHARIGAALAERFPQFTWRVAEWPLRDDTFSLIPMLGSIKAGGLLKPPDPYLLGAESRTFSTTRSRRTARRIEHILETQTGRGAPSSSTSE